MMETTPRDMVHIFVLVTGTWILIQTPGYDRGVEAVCYPVRPHVDRAGVTGLDGVKPK